MTNADARLRPVALLLFALALCPALRGQSGCGDEPLQATPNRPSVSSGADTTQCGVLEMENGFEHSAHSDQSHSRDLVASLRYGVTRRFDLIWSTNEYQSSALGNARVNGVGDNWFGGRLRFVDYGQWRPAVAVLYLAKAPTADSSKGLGDGRWEQQLTLILSKNLGPVHVDMNETGVMTYSGSRVHGGVSTLSVSGPLYKSLGWNVETYGGRSDVLHYASQLSALTWQVNKRLILDFAVDAGLTHGADHRRIAFGFTYAIGRLRR